MTLRTFFISVTLSFKESGQHLLPLLQLRGGCVGASGFTLDRSPAEGRTASHTHIHTYRGPTVHGGGGGRRTEYLEPGEPTQKDLRPGIEPATFSPRGNCGFSENPEGKVQIFRTDMKSNVIRVSYV